MSTRLFGSRSRNPLPANDYHSDTRKSSRKGKQKVDKKPPVVQFTNVLHVEINFAANAAFSPAPERGRDYTRDIRPCSGNNANSLYLSEVPTCLIPGNRQGQTQSVSATRHRGTFDDERIAPVPANVTTRRTQGHGSINVNGTVAYIGTNLNPCRTGERNPYAGQVGPRRNPTSFTKRQKTAARRLREQRLPEPGLREPGLRDKGALNSKDIKECKHISMY